MNILLSDQAKSEMSSYLADAKALRLTLTDGCCGKSFALEKVSDISTDDESAKIGELLFLMPKADAAVVGDVTIDSPGPLDGFLIAPKTRQGDAAVAEASLSKNNTSNRPNTSDKTYVLMKDALLGDVAIESPKAAELLAEFGLHCISCFANSFDTLEMGAMVHGMDPDEVDEMIAEINKELAKEE